MKNFLASVIAVLGILTVAPNASQAQSFTFTFGDGPGYYAPDYYPNSYYRGYYDYGPRHRYYRWRNHDLHEWNHD